MKVIKNITIYTHEAVITNGYVRFDKTIKALGSMDDYIAVADEEVINAPKGAKLIPGFIDVHTHGGYSFDTMDADSSKLEVQINSMLQEGITSIFPTTMTQSPAAIEAALATVAETAKKVPQIQGIHLEGPYVSVKHKGAQPEQYIKAPVLDEFKRWNKAANNLIRLVTYAPENDNTREFEDYLIAHNIVPSMGHTDATREQLAPSKASHATHLFNASRGLHHREAGTVGHALLERNIMAEIIVDGVHVTPDMVKLAFQMKGVDHISVITDAMRAKGLEDGVSELGGQTVYVKNKQARLEDGTLAGSVLTMDDAFRNMIEFTGCSFEDAIQMTSYNQAKEFGLTQKGDIVVGKDADFVLFDKNIQVAETYSIGRRYQWEEK
ncbi:N-acetylglucosamine-6-phosphate deacetylase [Brochothrix campestris]|uniref:N-acetylglucosamine-6-phosphate deacetylase n=1 Tax=Brochothrix campestris TaxID=2757 RepID=UPI0038D03BC2